eukprot:648443-Rhodomonas_salina.1
MGPQSMPVNRIVLKLPVWSEPSSCARCIPPPTAKPTMTISTPERLEIPVAQREGSVAGGRGAGPEAKNC